MINKFQQFKLYGWALVFTVIAALIGTVKFQLGPSLITLFPVFYTIILGLLSGPDVAKVMDTKLVTRAGQIVIVGICPFIVKLGISAGSNIEMILHAGPALLLHGFGNLLGIFFGLPLAIMLNLGRESVGATSTLNREYHMAVVNAQFGSESPEAKGSMAMYVVGGIIGTIYFGLMASAIGSLGMFDPKALGMSTGVGAGIFMASASAALAQMMPAAADTITTMASAANTVAGITGIYIAMFIALPLTNRLYDVLIKLKFNRVMGGVKHEI